MTKIMMKIFFILLLCICYTTITAQEQNNKPCGTKTPSLKWETWFSSKVKEYKIKKSSNAVLTNYTIPVIVHILHDGDIIGQNENISWAQVKSQIDILNADFSGTNSDISNVPPIFQSVIAGNTGIQFCLAKTDQDGNVLPEEGIDRINWVTKGWDDPESFWLINGTNFVNYYNTTIKPESIWDPHRYLNIWLSTKNILNLQYGFGLFPTGAGFSELPNVGAGIETQTTSGVWVHHERWGNIGTVNNNPFNTNRLGRVATHEIGHWLGVYHTFESLLPYVNGNPIFGCYGGANCANWGDRCCDTPPQSEEGMGCPAFQNICIESPIDTMDMFMNYMDYTNDQCRIMFTQDQANRMQTAMAYGTFRATLNASMACQNCPELVLLNPSASSSNVNAGSDITVNFIEKNKGLANAAPNYINFHLSADEILTPGLNGDIYLDQYLVNQTLASNSQTSLLSKQLNIPVSVTPGIYYLFFAADGTGVVSECVEDNNFATVIITVSNESLPSQASYRYWFDNKFQNAITVNGSFGNDYTIQSSISSTLLQQGLHTFSINFKDTSSKWSSIVSSFVYKSNFPAPSGSSRYEYWVDNYYPGKVIKNISNTLNLILIDNLITSDLNSGLHTFSIRFKPDAKHWSSVTSSFFYKPNETPAGSAQYEYWFDNDYDNKTTTNNAVTSNLILLDNLNTNNLNNGLHTFNIRFRPDGKKWSSVSSSFFYKLPVPVTGLAKYQYWFDTNFQDSVTTILTSSNNFILLDSLMNTASVGLHTLNIRFKPDGGLWSSVVSSFFYKNAPTNIINNTIARCVYWYDSNWQNPNLVYYSGQQNLSSIINTDAAELGAGMHRVSMMFRDERGLWSSVVSDSFNRGPITSPVCPFNNKQFVSQAFLSNNANRQWQVDVGAGFVNLANNANYSGVNSDSLQIINAPTSWYGYKYRCILTDGSSLANSQVFTLKFFLIWNGATDTGWENPANWSCNTLPDGNTDVIINSAVPRFPQINSNVFCRSLTTKPGVSVTVTTGNNLTITH